MPISNPANQIISLSSTTGSELATSLSSTASNFAPSNANRKGLTIYNSLSQTLYLDTSNAVSTSNFWLKLEAGAFYEMPEPIYTGAIWGMIATGTGSVEVREFV